MIAIDQPDILNLGANLDHQRRTFDLEILDDGNGIAIMQYVTVGILDYTGIIALSATASFDHSCAHSGQTNIFASS